MMYYDPIKRIEDLAALDRSDAAGLVDLIFDSVLIPALMRDPAITPRSFSEWTIALADVRTFAIGQIHRRIRGHLHRDDIVNLLTG